MEEHAELSDGLLPLLLGDGDDELEADARSVVLEVEGLGPARARYVVGADGMWSTLRRALGVSDGRLYLGEWHAFRQYFTATGPAACGKR